MSNTVIWHAHPVDKAQRESLKGHKPAIIWFTGLSGSGKSTLASALEKALLEHKAHTYLLDGDNIRLGLCKDLGFSDTDRHENIRRIAEVSNLFVDAGLIVLTAFISPFSAERDLARNLAQEGEFIEVYVNCPLEVCESRDPKGLYKKARAGEIPKFTGIDSPYEAPTTPELIVETATTSVEDCVKQIMSFLTAKGVLA